MVLLVLVSIMDAGCVNVSVFLLAEGVAEEEKKRGRNFCGVNECRGVQGLGFRVNRIF